jgi:hypothetical protein
MDLMMNNRAYFVHILEESFIIYELIYVCVYFNYVYMNNYYDTTVMSADILQNYI